MVEVVAKAKADDGVERCKYCKWDKYYNYLGKCQNVNDSKNGCPNYAAKWWQKWRML